MTTQRDSRLTPQEEFNRLPAQTRQRLEAIARHKFNGAAAARELGINASTATRTLKANANLFYRWICSMESGGDAN